MPRKHLLELQHQCDYNDEPTGNDTRDDTWNVGRGVFAPEDSRANDAANTAAANQGCGSERTFLEVHVSVMLSTGNASVAL